MLRAAAVSIALGLAVVACSSRPPETGTGSGGSSPASDPVTSVVSVGAEVARQVADCDERSGATLDMVGCLSSLSQDLDRQRLALLEASAVPDRVRQAEHEWVAFRDAECSAVYDATSDGSIRGVLQEECVVRLTQEHNDFLRDFHR